MESSAEQGRCERVAPGRLPTRGRIRHGRRRPTLGVLFRLPSLRFRVEGSMRTSIPNSLYYESSWRKPGWSTFAWCASLVRRGDAYPPGRCPRVLRSKSSMPSTSRSVQSIPPRSGSGWTLTERARVLFDSDGLTWTEGQRSCARHTRCGWTASVLRSKCNAERGGRRRGPKRPPRPHG